MPFFVFLSWIHIKAIVINPIQAGVFWNHIGRGGGYIVPPSVSPLFVIQLPPNRFRIWTKKANRNTFFEPEKSNFLQKAGNFVQALHDKSIAMETP